MKYKNQCKFPIYVKCLDRLVEPNETFEQIENDDTKKLVKENKLVIIETVEEKPIEQDFKKSKKTKKNKFSNKYNETKSEDN